MKRCLNCASSCQNRIAAEKNVEKNKQHILIYLWERHYRGWLQVCVPIFTVVLDAIKSLNLYLDVWRTPYKNRYFIIDKPLEGSTPDHKGTLMTHMITDNIGYSWLQWNS